MKFLRLTNFDDGTSKYPCYGYHGCSDSSSISSCTTRGVACDQYNEAPCDDYNVCGSCVGGVACSPPFDVHYNPCHGAICNKPI